jgi:hypothetical protein
VDGFQAVLGLLHHRAHCSSRATEIIMLTGLSSTIRMRAPWIGSSPSLPVELSISTSEASGSGSSAQKQLPWPGSLITPTSPPISRASSRQIDRPRPVPPLRRLTGLSTWVKG